MGGIPDQTVKKHIFSDPRTYDSTNLPQAKQGQTRIKANSKLPSTFQNLEFILALSERF